MKTPVYFSNNGTPATGLALSWQGLRRLSTGAVVVSPGTVATISEIGNGWYAVTYDATGANGELVGTLDGGAGLPAGDRYKPVQLRLSLDQQLLTNNDIQRALAVLGVRGGDRTTTIAGSEDRMTRPDGGTFVRLETGAGTTSTLTVDDE